MADDKTSTPGPAGHSHVMRDANPVDNDGHSSPSDLTFIPDQLPPLQQELLKYEQSLAGVFCYIACAWVVGCALAIKWPMASAWLGASGASLAVLVVLWMLGKLRSALTATVFGVVAIIAASGAWTSTMSSVQRADDIGRYAGEHRTLVRVTGQVDAPPRMSSPPRGAMAQFGYNSIATLYEMRVTSMDSAHGPVPVTGRLLVREPMRNDEVAQGQQLTVMGWLTAVSGPSNPGEQDFRLWMVDRGLSGFLRLPEPRSGTLVHEPQTSSGLVTMQATAGRLAMQSLAQGLKQSPRELALLQTLLLGRKSQGLEQTQLAFRRVGLAHILSISGAHLGILVSLVAVILVMAGVGPWMVAWLLTLVLGFYLLAIPPQVPVLRAAIMALMLVWGFAAGRRVPLLDPLAMACVIVLMWRPHELYAPGFQLSFGVVAALICFTAPVARVLSPRPALVGMRLTTFQRIVGWCMAYVAANLVAFFIALPLVMYHFHNVSPMTVLLSIITLPLVTVVLGLGYIKIAIGLFLPGLGGDLAIPLWWATHALQGVVLWASEFRIVYIELAHGPSAAWTAAAVVMVIAVFAGWFARRRAAFMLCLLLLIGWLTMLQWGYRTQAQNWPALPGPDVTLRVNYFSVGDGNCFLLRFMPQTGRPYTMMYDCGSRWTDGGLKTIIPALNELGVREIDTLVLSHADMDHFNATIDLSWRVNIKQVLVSPQMARAINEPSARFAPAYLLTYLRKQNIDIQTISRGWQQQKAGGLIEALWPAADFEIDDALNDNDLSVVLSVKAAGRRLLLSGDIQKIAMQQVLARGDDLAADLIDMPHHGSFVRGNSLNWIHAISPAMVIQSCGMNRVEKDPWKMIFPDGIKRVRTAESGMVEVDFKRDGKIVWRTYKTGSEVEHTLSLHE